LKGLSWKNHRRQTTIEMWWSAHHLAKPSPIKKVGIFFWRTNSRAEVCIQMRASGWLGSLLQRAAGKGSGAQICRFIEKDKCHSYKEPHFSLSGK
jgi:hypothetical protein